ncbi:uncharacterized protein LOC133804857 [Humulus lupulus]|uniref:uncharacterized protein LOC133804857 n=1 Tax=Humulus lupulus TaxID=3486 RepID=UPI002B4082CA|nr:uncharacterized protein LOC133804857 [Humulus lupulus]
MDSGNSGSMQSSSGGDEEYDSRAESISALLSSNPQGHVSHMANHHAPPQQHPHHHQSSMFDPLSNFFDPTAVSSRSPLNLDMGWSRTLRSDPNSTDLGSGLMPSSSTHNQSHPFFANSQYGQGQSRGSGFGIGGAGVGGGVNLGGGGVGLGSNNTFQGIQIPLENNNGPRGTNPGAVSGTSTQNDVNNNVVRNPKKRSRASRRAPTTVLTTDTTNFRAMVQEFTGIPAPPFTSSPFPRTTRLDLFGTGGGGSSMMRSGPLDSPPPYILRPFAQKVQAPQLQPTTSFIPPTSTSSASLLSSASVASTSTAINYQQPPPGGSGSGGQNPLLMQNPVLNFHSLLQAQAQAQAQPKFSLSKPQTLGPLDHQISHHALEDFGLSHHGLSGLPSHMSSDLPLRSDGNHPATASPPTTTATLNWGDQVGMGLNDNNNNNRSGNDNNNNNNVDHQHHHHHLLMRSMNGGGPTTSTNNGKQNYSASSSDFHGGKGPENVTTRSEGMVESWICSSD